MGDGHHTLHGGGFAVGEVGDIGRAFAGGQGGLQGLGVHQLTPGQVDNADPVLHGGEGGVVEGPLGLGGHGQVEGDIIGLAVELLQGGDHLHAGGQVQGVLHGQEGVIAHNLHAQGGGGVGHQHADGPQAHHTQGFALDLRTHVGGLALFHHGGHVGAGGSLLLHPGDALGDLPGGQQQGGNGKLLHPVGVGAGGVEDHNARLGGPVQGDVVHPGPGPGDAQQLGGEVIVVELGRTHQNGVLVLHGVADLEPVVQLGQADLGDLIHRLNMVHNDSISFLNLPKN